MDFKGISLRINEIFKSIQGESTYAGIPCVFIRLTGCNLRCSYCDTTYAYEDGRDMTIEEIINTIGDYRCKNLCITGGEPLLQENVHTLINLLKKNRYRVFVETNGSLNIDLLPDGVINIMDIKCPDSNMDQKTDWKNIQKLKPKDEIKFVISSKNDYEWAKKIIDKYEEVNKATVLFGLVQEKLKPETLAGWILKDGIDVRLQLQLHKIIWPDKEKGT